MRILLFTGKGGVGKTTAAAATATLAAGRGLKTLVLSTDTAHSLADALGASPGGELTEIRPGLHLRQVDTRGALEAHWGELRDYLSDLLADLGLDVVTAEEITVLPGAEEIIALLELRGYAQAGRWDLIVVDCAPSAETLRLLALPEALDWHVTKLMPVGRRLAKVTRPFIRSVAKVTAPGDEVMNAAERLHRALKEVRELLTGPAASVRLVLTPESVVLAEARRTLTSLNLYGYRVDAVIANRVFPAEGADEWRARWVAAQSGLLTEAAESFGPLPLHVVPYLSAEPVGEEALREVGELLYAGHPDPFAPPTVEPPLRVVGHTLRLSLPGARKGEVDLARKGEELIVTAGPYRRILALPAGLARRRIAAATLHEGALEVRFEHE